MRNGWCCMSWNSRTRHHTQRGPSTAPPLSPQGSPSHFRVHSIHLKFSHVNTRTCASQFINILTTWLQFYQSLAFIPPPCHIVDLTSQKEESCSFANKTIFIQGLMIIKWPKFIQWTHIDRLLFKSRKPNCRWGERRAGFTSYHHGFLWLASGFLIWVVVCKRAEEDGMNLDWFGRPHIKM